jgi:hypothetical protein
VRTYLVFEPAGGLRNAETADAVIFLREKFSWPALFFAPLWLLWHRLWLGFIGWLAAVMLIAGAAYFLDLVPVAAAIALGLPTLVVAFEGTELRRRKLLRSDYRDAGVAIGEDIEDAERRFFQDWPARAEARRAATQPAPGVLVRPPAAPTTASTPLSDARSVIGLFPEPGGRR